MSVARLAVILVVGGGLGCGDDAPVVTAPVDAGLCQAPTRAPWLRSELGVGGAVTINEVMYHPTGAAAVEWVELYNPLAIEVDLAGFRLDGAVQFGFPAATRIPAGGFVVVAASAALPGAVGTFTGALPDDGGALQLWNNAGRLLDAVTYADREPWPVIAAGSGASLAKRAADTASEPAEAWTASARVGGTPGAANFPAAEAALTVQTLVALDASWRYQASGAAPDPGWASPGYDDATWPVGAAAFFAADQPAAAVTATATFTADNYLALYLGKADGSGLRLIGRDAVGDWTSPETWSFTADPDDHLYVAAWESPTDHGGPQMVIGQVALPDGTVVATDPATFEWTLGPPGAAPGGALTDPAPTPAQVAGVIAGATWTAPQAAADNRAAPWGPALAGQFAPATRFLWADTFGDVSAANLATTFVLFRSKRTLIPPRGATELGRGPTTTYFRTRFQVADGLALIQPGLDLLIDDGAVIYLNGVEVLRVRMPAGGVGATTLAAATVTEPTLSLANLVDASAVAAGDNVLAVELHQATVDDPDLRFAVGLRSAVTAAAPGGPPAGLAFNEVAGADPDDFWLELTNLGAAPIDLGGHVIVATAGGERILAPGSLAPGAVMVVTQAELGFGASVGDKLFLVAPDRGAIVDGIEVVEVPRGRRAAEPDWRYLEVATPGAANRFPAPAPIVINEILYHAPPVTAPDGSVAASDLEWIELHNPSPAPVAVGGFQLVDAVGYQLPAGLVMAPDGYLVVAKDVAAVAAAYPGLTATVVGDYQGSLGDAGDRVVLRDACGNPVAAVGYADGGPWPGFADGGGSSLELRHPGADPAAAEAWAASDEAPAGAWQTISYDAVAAPSAVGPDGVWQELVVGLLDAGVVLIDDVSVIVDPAGAATELIAGGSFEAGAAGFRLLGNHRHSAVITDPADPANHVLRLVATGATEHMHNHLETTLTRGHAITNGRAYRISLRARWQAGSNQLNTRLYFDRLARTTALARPVAPGSPGARNRRAETALGPTYRDLRHHPAVPGPDQPVVVSVLAADPDGVAGVTLWSAVDGGAPTSLPMTRQDDGRFAATVPGRPASSVVQIWVVGADPAGATSSYPARGPGSRALWKVDDGLAARNGLHNLRVVMTPADTAWLFDVRNVMSNDPVAATVIDGEREVYYDVGVRLKSSERGRSQAARVGFALRFSPTQRFRGIHRSAMIDRSQGVGFGQRELLFNQAMNHAGTVTSQYDDLIQVLPPRPEHAGAAHLQLARYGDLLLDFQFDRGGDGALFEYELIYYPTTTDDGTATGAKLPQPDAVVGTAIRDLGDDREAYRLPFITKNNRWRDDYRGLIRFAKVFGLPAAEFDAQVGDVIDVDEWLRAFAFATLSGAVDNYGHGSQHNADFYVRPSDGRVLYFPHDLDFLGSPQGAVVGSGDLARLIARPERARAYYGHLHDIIATSFNGPYMAYWSDHLGRLLPGQDFAGHLQFIIARADWVLTAAPDAVLRVFPRLGFQITTNGGAAVTVATPTVVVDGQGWIDVAAVHQVGAPAPVALTWTSRTTWRATLALTCGSNPIQLDAVDRHAQPVGADAITVTRTGPGCP